jgi:hypothetical protein
MRTPSLRGAKQSKSPPLLAEGTGQTLALEPPGQQGPCAERCRFSTLWISAMEVRSQYAA